MNDIENYLESFADRFEWIGIDLENNWIDDKVADRLYKTFLRRGNAIFDTYGMYEDLDGLKLLNCLLDHFTAREDYRRCKWIKKRKEGLIRLMGYFDRCRREKVARVRAKRGVQSKA